MLAGYTIKHILTISTCASCLAGHRMLYWYQYRTLLIYILDSTGTLLIYLRPNRRTVQVVRTSRPPSEIEGRRQGPDQLRIQGRPETLCGVVVNVKEVVQGQNVGALCQA